MYGVFISYRRKDWGVAGRIYDRLKSRGFEPFLDVESLRQGPFPSKLEDTVKETPFFLCLLTKNTFSSLNRNWVIEEIRLALQYNKEIILIAEPGFVFPNLPDDIKQITEYNYYNYTEQHFLGIIDRICDEKLYAYDFKGSLNWESRVDSLCNVYLSNRTNIEQNVATLYDIFGKEYVEAVSNGANADIKNRVKRITISCYAATQIFASDVGLTDHCCFDRGLLLKILEKALTDKDFTFEIVMNAPYTRAYEDAIASNKLGNRALEKNPNAIFLSSIYNIEQLIKTNKIFKQAYKHKRFNYIFTDTVLPYSIFNVQYKNDANDYIKVDLYSINITESMNRRSMIILKSKEKNNYDFFKSEYDSIRNTSKSDELSKNKDKWLDEWKAIRNKV